MAERRFDLTLNPEIAIRLVELLREYDEEDILDAETEPEADFEPDLDLDDFEEGEGGGPRQDPFEDEINSLVESLDVDSQRDLLALIWVGRGDYDAGDWSEARRQARETADGQLATYLRETPLASDYINSGLADLGYPTADV